MEPEREYETVNFFVINGAMLKSTLDELTRWFKYPAGSTASSAPFQKLVDSK